MICGNEEAIIEQCLDSAMGAFDELSLVRAVGTKEPDSTVALAREWCERNDKKFRFQEYFNEAHFPHVDDFTAARNQSFYMARGELLLWLDCDDYLDEINCRRIRELESNTDYRGFYCPYVIDEVQGAQTMRERLIRRGSGRWKNPIHETCVITGPTCQVPQIIVRHREHEHKHQSSAARNTAILTSILSDVPRQYFYLHAELKLLGKSSESIAA